MVYVLTQAAPREGREFTLRDHIHGAFEEGALSLSQEPATEAEITGFVALGQQEGDGCLREAEGGRDKETEVRLIRSEASLTEAYRIARLGNWDWNIVTNQLTWSGEVYRIFGIQPSEFGASYPAFLERVHPDDRCLVEEAVERALRREESYMIHHRVVRPDGGLRFVLERGEVYFDPSGAPVRMIGTVQDVTELRRAEEAARATKFAVDYGSMPTFSNARDGRFTYANRAGCASLGYTLDELLRLSVPDINPDVTWNDWPIRWAEVREKGSITIVTRHRRKDGHIFPVEVRVNYVEQEGGRVWAYAQDITERIAAEEALRESERRFRAYVDSAPGGIFVVDREGRYVDVNPGAVRMTEFTREELLEMTIEDLTPEAAAPHSMKLFHRLLESGRVEGEILLKRKRGEPFWASIYAVALGAGRYMGFCADITERRRVEESIRAALREKEVLLKEIHHRVKNNLQIVASLLNLQAMQSGDPSVARYLDESRRRVESMALVHECLYGGGDLACVNFAAYVRNLVSSIQNSYTSGVAPILFKLSLAPAPLNIETAVPCGLILNELITNVIEHAFPAGATARGDGPCIDISLDIEEEGWHVLRLADNGVGFSPDLDGGEFASLGLQLIRDLARQLQAVIEVSSGEGTCWRIRFREAPYKPRLAAESAAGPEERREQRYL